MIDAVLSEYVAAACDTNLPVAVVVATKAHIADTLAAGVSGTCLEAGRMGVSYAKNQPTLLDVHRQAEDSATIWGSSLRAQPAIAALANAMAAHADETDDSHTASGTHPGSSIVPAVLSAAESMGAPGIDVIRAVTLGYDMCARMPVALWPDVRHQGSRNPRSSHAAGGLLGAVASLAALHRFSPREVRTSFTLAGHMFGGIRSYFRDGTHVEKAYVYAGLPAHSAVFVTGLVRAGWTAATDPFDGTPSVFDLVDAPDKDALVADLGGRFEVEQTRFKKFPVASPAQSPIEALGRLMRAGGLRGSDITSVDVRICPTRLITVGDRPLPNVNLQYLLDCLLDDGDLSFVATHDTQRFETWIRQGRHQSRVVVRGDESLRDTNGASVSVTSRTGAQRHITIAYPPGDPRNPIGRSELEQKWVGLMAFELGHETSVQALAVVDALEDVEDVRNLTRLLQVPAADRPTSKPQTSSTRSNPAGPR